MSDKLHKLLRRQLSTLGIDASHAPSDQLWEALLSRVSKTYDNADQDRYLLERSIEISSKEMQVRWQEVKLLEQQWRSLSECTPDFVVLLDPNGNIVFSNRTQHIDSTEKLIGKSFLSLYGTEQVGVVQHMISESVRTQLPMHSDLTSMQYGSEPKYFSLRATPVIKNAEVVGIVVVETDITENRKASEYRDARKRAELAAESKARFLANMSHEIRTPLNGILGMVELLAEQITDEEVADKLNIIRTSGEGLLSIVNDILDFSKLESGKVTIENHPFSIKECVSNVIALLEPRATEKGLGLRYSIDPAVPTYLQADSPKIRQVLLNLVGNSLKFTEKGEIRVTVTAAMQTDGSYQIHFSIQDTGPGMSEADQKKLFQPFFQVDSGNARKGRGTGLGLSICRGLTQSMGGDIGVKSKQGSGTEFFFWIAAQKSEEAGASAPAAGVWENLAEKHPLMILIAEDNLVNQKVALGFLRKFGYQADVVENGQQAIDSNEAKRYDVIFMDCDMPVMDGFSATRRICTEHHSDRPKIIALTASTLAQDTQLCRESGMDDVLGKPISPDKLGKILRAIPARGAKGKPDKKAA